MKRKQKKLGFSSKPLSKLQRKNAKPGQVFIVRDILFNPASEPGKIRRVVVVENHGGNLYLAPIRRESKNLVSLSNFDGERAVNVSKARMVKIDQIYLKKNFNGTGNDYLTEAEKRKVRKAYLRYKRSKAGK